MQNLCIFTLPLATFVLQLPMCHNRNTLVITRSIVLCNRSKNLMFQIILIHAIMCSNKVSLQFWLISIYCTFISILGSYSWGGIHVASYRDLQKLTKAQWLNKTTKRAGKDIHIHFEPSKEQTERLKAITCTSIIHDATYSKEHSIED